MKSDQRITVSEIEDILEACSLPDYDIYAFYRFLDMFIIHTELSIIVLDQDCHLLWMYEPGEVLQHPKFGAILCVDPNTKIISFYDLSGKLHRMRINGEHL